MNTSRMKVPMHIPLIFKSTNRISRFDICIVHLPRPVSRFKNVYRSRILVEDKPVAQDYLVAQSSVQPHKVYRGDHNQGPRGRDLYVFRPGISRLAMGSNWLEWNRPDNQRGQVSPFKTCLCDFWNPLQLYITVEGVGWSSIFAAAVTQNWTFGNRISRIGWTTAFYP